MPAQLFGFTTNGQAVPPSIQDAINQAVTSATSKSLPTKTDMNTVTTEGNYTLGSMTGVTNTPDASIGYVRVVRSGNAIRQDWFSLARPVPMSWTRVRAADGTWRSWYLTSTFGAMPLSSKSLDDMRDVGFYPIQSASHPALPAPVVGTLEVLPSTGFVTQRFTSWETVPRVFRRRAISATTWSPWSQDVTRPEVTAVNDRVSGIDTRVKMLESAPPPVVSGGTVALSTPTRSEVTVSPVETVSKPGRQIVVELDSDRISGWNYSTSSLSQTEDYGVTWRQLNDKSGANPFAGAQVESVLHLDNDELLVTCIRGVGVDGRREVWVTKNLRDSATREFTKTMTARAPGVKFTSAWSQSTYGRIVLVNEYGPKTGLKWGDFDVAAGENARYTYLSVDYGKTWRTIFDLNTYLTTTQGHTTTDVQHLHGVAWDPWWDRVWVSFGDNSGGAGSNGVVYSDDMGATWQTAHYYKGQTAPNQVVGIVPMPRCVLFGGDNGSPDVLRIDRSEGKYKTGGYSMPIAFDSTASGKHLLQGKSRVRRRGDDAPALFAFCAEGADSPSFVTATMDGYKFVELWRDSVSQEAGFGCRSVVGPTLTGRVIVGSHDKKVDGMWSEVSLVAPGY